MGTTRIRLAAVAGMLTVALLAGAAPASAQLGPQALVDISSPVLVKEPGSPAVMRFNVVLDRRLAQTVTVAYQTEADSAVNGEDYVTIRGTRTFPPGQLVPREGPILVTLLANPELEGPRRFFVDLPREAAVNATPGVRRGIGTIVAAGPSTGTPRVSVGNLEVVEGNSGTTTAELPVTLSQAVAQPVQVSYRTSDGTAIAATGDYTAVPSGTLTIPAGAEKATIPVTVKGDTQPELNESFDVVLTGATNAVVAPTNAGRRGRAVIRNDDGPHLTISDVARLEGADGQFTSFDFTVTLLQPAQNATVTVDYSTEDGTAVAADPGEVNGGDYVHTAGTLQFPPGRTERPVRVRVIGDDWPEKSEDFFVVLGNAQTSGVTSGVTLLKERGVGTIVNDDGPELVPGADVELDQPGRSPVTVEVPVTVEGDDRRVPSSFRVHYRTVGGSADGAKPGVDFEETSGVLEIARDATAGVISVEVLPSPAGPDRSFTLELSRPDYGRLTRDAVKITIVGPPDASGDVPTETDEASPRDRAVGLTRAAGRDRIATAVAVSQAHWDSADAAVLATAATYPDALAGGAVAAGLGAPMLLTTSANLAQPVAGELARLGVRQVWILGGPAAISTAVEQRLVSDGYEVVRLAGRDRFATAAAAAGSVGLPASGEVALALGAHEQERRAWPDALSAGALAASPDQVPVLLTEGNRLPPATVAALDALDARRVVLLGGQAAISAAVEARVAGLGYEVVRLSGPSRYATSAAVAADALQRWGGDRRVPVVFATGENFPDGLAAGALAARLDGIVLLVPKDTLDLAPEVRALLRANLDRLGAGIVVGGSAAVSDQVHDQLKEALRQ